MTSGPRRAPGDRSSSTWSSSADVPRLSRPFRVRALLVVVFVALVGAFAAGLWGTVLRPAAFEVQGEFVATAAGVILVRHRPIAALGMGAMETMAVLATAEQTAGLDLKPGDHVRLAVRPRGDDLVLVWIKKRA
jgi:Cu/Ag efflux protein CusF